MSEITASMVKDLREKTGAGMMDCKKALTEMAGDFEAAVDWLRKKGLAAAAKKSARVAAEGLIAVSSKGTQAAVVEVNAETDFVGRNELFQSTAREIADVALGAQGDLEKLKTLTMSSGATVEAALVDLVAKIGENMGLRRTASLSVSQGVVATYIHSAVAPQLGRIGVLVGLESAAPEADLHELGKRLAMHVAASAPVSLSVQDIDPALVEREKAILVDQAQSSGRPAEIIEKMVEGRLRKFYEEVVFLEQTFVMNNDKKVSQIVEDEEKRLGMPIKVTGFVRFGLGEGIEKEVSNFAEEVAAQIAGTA